MTKVENAVQILETQIDLSAYPELVELVATARLLLATGADTKFVAKIKNKAAATIVVQFLMNTRLQDSMFRDYNAATDYSESYQTLCCVSLALQGIKRRTAA